MKACHRVEFLSREFQVFLGEHLSEFRELLIINLT